jgi:acetyl-CoA carboxylase biotin carboxyl carrier protein
VADGAQKTDMTQDLTAAEDTVRSLARLLTETGLTEIEIEQGGLRVRVARPAAGTVGLVMPPSSTLIEGPRVPAPLTVGAPENTIDAAKHPGMVASPMVGTAYRSPEPGAKPFIDVGSRVKAGEPLLIIEAMKTMNQIPAPRDGVVTQILFEDAQPVEFGEPLVIVE